MRVVFASATAVAGAVMLTALLGAQGAQPQQQDETTRTVPGGGIMVAGWQGSVDDLPTQKTNKITDSKFTSENGGFHIITGPSGNFWNPADVASGDYTVSATFREPKFQNLMTHPHPYGLFIGGNKMGTPDMTMLYCAAYGSGTFIVRGFGPAPFQMNGRRGEANPAVHKAPAINEPVEQMIAWTVKGGRAECSINGTVVAGYDKADIVAPGKLESLDGVYGIRTAHNVEFDVTGLSKK